MAEECENCGEPVDESMQLAFAIVRSLNGKPIDIGAQALVHAMTIVITQHPEQQHPADMKLMRDNIVAMLFAKTESWIEDAFENLSDAEQAETTGVEAKVLN